MFRFGIGRFTTEEEIDYTVERTIRHVKRLREMRLVKHKIPFFSLIQLLVTLSIERFFQSKPLTLRDSKSYIIRNCTHGFVEHRFVHAEIGISSS